MADAGLFGLPFSVDDAKLVIVPVPWDVTTSYRAGTSAGPDAIRLASHQLDLFDVETGEPWKAGIVLAPVANGIAEMNTSSRVDAEKVIEVGGVIGDDRDLHAALERVNTASAQLNDIVYREVDALLAKGKLVGLLGGDHSSPYGAIARLARDHSFGILHVDAHADLRVAYEGFAWSHASIMHNVMRDLPQVTKLVQVGIRDLSKDEHDQITGSRGRIHTYFDAHLAARKQDGEAWGAIANEIVDSLPKDVYLSFDIDGLEPMFCPNTGTPVPGGLHFTEACTLIRKLVERGHRILGFDLNEVAPGSDGSEWDANVGARILYKMCGWALKSQGY
jgi:agmatinase